ncbi:tetratricopeptide repeat protein [Mucilaginibacter sp. P25]|uniref:tetratricopeptide repeat protein n=1 Tax=Mucilaginibacter sp. P25 TaxID=3423945 RepID=UPI003D798223
MRALYIVIILAFCFSGRLLAQDNELLLARQYNANGEPQKALEIYQKLYKQNNENYYSVYINTLLNLKKFDEAESITKKLIRRHPDDHQYAIMLGNIYTQGAIWPKLTLFMTT